MKGFKFLLTIFAACLLLFGCSNDTTQDKEVEDVDSSEVQEDRIHVTISRDEGEEFITEKEIEIDDKQILMDVMKENFDIEEDSGFITSIEGVAPEEGEEKAWMYFVNDEMAMVGANEFELSPGDKVLFDLQAWE